MRAAAIASAAVIAIGIYLAFGSSLGLSTSWIALGVLGIAIIAAVAVMATGHPPGRSLSR